MARREKKIFVALSPPRRGTGKAGGSRTASKKVVFCGMSGGVDSSVAALLLKEAGYGVVGVFMRCFNLDGCAERDAEDARRVAEQLKIPFYVWDFEEEYKKRVVEYMIDGYRKGITPNPDVMCNKEIKFGIFFEKARAAGADYVATGHYVRRLPAPRHRLSARSSGDPQSALSARRSRVAGTELAAPARAAAEREVAAFGLFEAKDKNKDQSYFLWTLTEEKLRHCLFPIGDYLKSEVRAIAKDAGLPTAEKKDSQGICFLGKVTLADFLKEYIPVKRGAVVSMDGRKLGEHSGSHFYTVGQRHIGVSAIKHQVSGGGNPKPVYVAEKDIKSNTLVVAEGSENPALYKKEFGLSHVNFTNPSYSNILKNIGIKVWARVRYRQPLAAATLTFADFTQTDADKLPRESAYSPHQSALLVFEQGQKFVAPGQSAVLYIQEGNPSLRSGRRRGWLRMIGGGIIQ